MFSRDFKLCKQPWCYYSKTHLSTGNLKFFMCLSLCHFFAFTPFYGTETHKVSKNFRTHFKTEMSGQLYPSQYSKPPPPPHGALIYRTVGLVGAIFGLGLKLL